MATPHRTVPRLSETQLAHLKLEGYLVLPAVLDPLLLSRARDHIWSVLAKEVPRLRRDDPRTWTTIGADEPTGDSEAPWPDDTQLREENKYFTAGGHRFYLHCAEEELFRQLFPLALNDVAEQLLGEGTVLMPQGPGDDGLVYGQYFNSMNGGTHKALVGVKKYVDVVDQGANEFPPSMATEQIAVPPSSPFVGALTGCRGAYCTLPMGDSGGGVLPGVQRPSNTRGHDGYGGYAGAHADTATLTSQPNIHAHDRCTLRATCYLDDTPQHCGGFTVWPRSHVPIWHHTRECMRDQQAYHPYEDPVRSLANC